MHEQERPYPLHPILVVDDEAQALLSMSITLRSSGFNNLRMCSEPLDVAGLLARETFSLVLLDLNMPQMSGHEILRQTAGLMTRPPVVIVTASSQTRDYAEGAAAGAADYLVKPIDRDRLLDVVRRALSRPSRGTAEKLARDYLISDRIADGFRPADPPGSGGVIRMLEQTRREYRRLVGNLPIPYILLDQETFQVRWCNVAFLRFAGLDPSTPPDRVSFIDMLDDAGRERLASCLRNGGELKEEELRGETPGGRAFVIAGSFRTSPSDSYVDGGFIDVTGHARLQEQLARATRLETIGRFASGLAHDFNNTLLVVSGFAEMISQDPGASGPISEYAREILRAAAKAQGMLRQLLSMGKSTPGVHVCVDLNGALREQEPSLRQHLLPGQSLVFSLDAADPLVDISADRIDQVVRNLVLNARDAMPAGGTITITTRTGEEAPSSVALEVQDTGTGMDAATQAKIFEPFFTTKPRGSGTGLGLPMVQQVVEAAGGSIEVESRPGQGTLFRIHVPSASAGKHS